MGEKRTLRDRLRVWWRRFTCDHKRFQKGHDPYYYDAHHGSWMECLNCGERFYDH